MSNKNLVKKIAMNSISETNANAISGFMASIDTMTDNARARVRAMNAWDRTHNWDTVRRAGLKKNAPAAAVSEYEKVKAARADYSDIMRKDISKKNAPARAIQSDAIVTLFGRGGKNDNSKPAAAFRHFYAAYTAYRAEMSFSDNTEKGKAAISALSNLYSVCFGFEFRGGVARDVSRRTLNLLGVRAANTAENMKGANGIAVFTENQTKRLLICIAANLIEKGIVDVDIIVLDTARADYAAAMRG